MVLPLVGEEAGALSTSEMNYRHAQRRDNRAPISLPRAPRAQNSRKLLTLRCSQDEDRPMPMPLDFAIASRQSWRRRALVPRSAIAIEEKYRRCR